MTSNQTPFRCHDADACAMGQKPCPTPDACGVQPQPEALRDKFELAYATEWAASRNGSKTPEQLAQKIKGWREGDTYPTDMPYLKHTWDGFRWAAQAQADELEATRNMLDTARSDLELLREALGVPVEPHQSLSERMLEAAQAQDVQRDAALIAQMREALLSIGTHTITDEDGDDVEVCYCDQSKVDAAIAASAAQGG